LGRLETIQGNLLVAGVIDHAALVYCGSNFGFAIVLLGMIGPI
jgi:hypothetical protein